MKLARLPYEQAAVADFYQEALERLGAVCERTWFDRLQVVAEGAAAKLWNTDGALHDVELEFPAPNHMAPRDAAHEVFPGCPLTFRLTEMLRHEPLPFERVVLGDGGRLTPPAPEVAEKLWHVQRPGANRWRLEAPFTAANHFSLLALVRCEIQAIDQQWSLHRLALALPGGERDDSLVTDLDFAEVVAQPTEFVSWPSVAPARMKALLAGALTGELESELGAIRTRQENYLRRELDRVDDYFAGYERELGERAARSSKDPTKLKAAERLAAARTEHTRRRDDQVERHALRVIPHFDAVMLVAEPAWQTRIALTHLNETLIQTAIFVPRSRRWFVPETGGM